MNLALLDREVFTLPEVIEDRLTPPTTADDVIVCAFTRRGNLLAGGCKNGAVVVWDFDTHGVARVLVGGHAERVTSVSWTRSSRRILSSSADGTVKLWDLATFACVRTILPVLGPVTSVHFLHPADPTTAILIGTSNNSVLSTYTSPITGTPALLQTLTMTNPNPQHLNVNVDATGEFVCIGEFPARA